MEESTLQIISILKLLTAVGVAALYAYGGMSGKWKRRFIAPVLLFLAVAGFSLWQGSFKWWVLLSVLPYFGSLSIGYGESSSLNKLLKSKYLTRFVVAMAFVVSALPLVITYQSWVLFGLHTVFLTSTIVIMGSFNPVSARAEETIIGFIVAFLPLFLIGGS